MTPKQLIKYMFFTRKRWRLLIIALALLSSLAGIASPYFQKLFIDTLLHTTGEHGPFSSFSFSSPLVLIVISFLLLLASQAFNFYASYLGTKESLVLQNDLSEMLYKKTLSLRTDSLRGKTVGEIVSIYATDVMGATIFLEQTLPTGAATLFPLIIAPIVLYWLYELPLAPLLSVIGCIIVINTILAFRQSTFFMRFKILAAERIGLVNEWVQNMRTLKILGWIEAYEEKIINKRNTETDNRVTMVTNGQVMNSISASITFFINLIAIYTLIQYKDHVTAGDLLSLLWVLGIFLTKPFRQMPWFFTFGFDGWTSTKRISDFLVLHNSGRKINESVTSEGNNPNISGSAIEVKNLNLKIKNRSILKNINLHIAPKEFVAIVGEVGSGKSLLLLSLMGETGAEMDSYSIDGKNMLSASLRDLCKFYSYVPQDGFVMSASLRENIALEYLFSNKQDARIISSLEKAQFNLSNENVPEQLDTEIGERGVNLSGGQKQRVNIARADFFDCPVLLLDDCLSALDVNTEKKLIAELLKEKWQNKTRLLATHRLSVLEEVDRIIYLVDGAVEAEGTLKNLMANSIHFQDYINTLNNNQRIESEE